MSQIITLTTDFGNKDSYAATLKGVILSICPEAILVDISHHVDSHDVMDAAFVLKRAAPHFPAGTIHLVVVDPGVGSVRKPVAVGFDGQRFVGPDNGVFALIAETDAPEEIVVLDNKSYWRGDTASNTFHGRDIFAPVCAHLARGVPLDVLGTSIDRLTNLRWALPVKDEQGLRGWVTHIDNFGNCITNITSDDFAEFVNDRRIKTYVGSAIIAGLSKTYSDVVPSEPVVLFGSDDHFEIAVNSGNAAELLNIRKGDSVNIVFVDAMSTVEAGRK